MNKLIYYPSILIPSEWLKKTIFYSDEISSIYPYGFTPSNGIRESQALADMEYLKSLGMYRYTRPEDIDSLKYKAILKDITNAQNESGLEALRTKFNCNSVKYEIYRSKMDRDIIKYLKFNGLAEESPKGDSLIVEESIALKYMSLVAKYSVDENNSYNIATDKMQNKSHLFDESNNMGEDYLKFVFDKIPHPTNDVSLADIIEFKDRHRTDLLNFRSYINSSIDTIKANKSPHVFNSICDDFERYSIEISQMMKCSGITFTFDDIEIIAPFIVANAVFAYQNTFSKEALSAGIITTVVSVGLKKIRTLYESNTNSDNPLNYLLEAQRNNLL